MYKLIIVDDEDMIRDGISMGINWNELGFEVIGHAANGLEAIEAVKKSVPDVLITDIRMPEMDGVELMEFLSENYPSIKLVVLSGYNDFEYLKSSIKNNVFDYILKPTLISEFVELFKRLKIVLDEEYQKKKEYENLRKSLINNLPYLERIFLNQLVIGMFHDMDELEGKKKFYKLDWLEGSLIIAILELDNLQFISKEISEEKLQLLKLFVIEIANRITSETMPGKFFMGNDGSIIGICCVNGGLRNLLNIIREIQKEVSYHKRISISAGISNVFQDISDISAFFEQARQALKQKLCLGRESIIQYSDIENIIEDSYPSVNFDFNLITDYVFAGDQEEISKYILSKLNIFKNKMYSSFEFVDSCILKLLFELDGYFYQYGISIKDILSNEKTCFQDIFTIDTLEQKASWIITILHEVSKEISQQRNSKVTKIIAEVIRYLENNYTSNSICLESVADLFKKSPPYLSKLFKEETGENFSDYLARLRMERAKVLLKDVKVKVYEVPAMVGYADISHFSRKFKNYVGMSPAQYKNE